MKRFLHFRSLSEMAQRFVSLGYFLPAVLALIAVGFMVVRIDLDERDRHVANERSAVSRELARLASSLQSNINGDVKLAAGLAAILSVEPGMDQRQFERVAERLFKEKSQIREVAGARNFVVNLVHPFAPNAKILGFDYRTNPEQSEAALKVRDSDAAILTGPVALVQGGKALIVRYPVSAHQTDGTDQFWGILSAVVDLDRLYADSGLASPDASVDVAISLASQSREAAPFFGDASVFRNDPVLKTIDLGYDVWNLAALPRGGWSSYSPGLSASRLYSLFVAVFVVGPLVWVGQLMRQRQKYIAALQQREDVLETLSHRLQLALEASEIGVWEFDDSTQTLIWDRRMRALYGVPLEKITGEYDDWRNALHPDDLERAEKVFAQALADETNYTTEFRVVMGDGEVRYIRAYGLTYRSSHGDKRIVGANWNVTNDVLLHKALKEAHALAELQNKRLAEVSRTLEHQSLHDALTELPNRRYLDRYLAHPTQGALHVILHADLDNFKGINDRFGHAAGDEVLRVAASRLRATLQEGEFAARIGGDEFIVVAPTQDPRSRASALAEAIHEIFSHPIVGDGFQCLAGASLGVATQSAEYADLDQLLVDADVALYEAKKRGRRRVEYFSEALRLSTLTAKTTADEFLRAFENDEIFPFFQPQFDAHTLEIVGVEALARWRHPIRGVLTPDKFLGTAEGLNKVAEIDAVILKKSLLQASIWAANRLGVPRLSVNISAQRLRDEALLQTLGALPRLGTALSLELLESISFDEQDQGLLTVIQKIKSFGVEIEIDDFGTGHASINSLIELAPHRLKIDRKLIAPIPHSVGQQRLVSSIIEIGRSMGIQIIAEGVETLAHADILRRLGCDTFQGYAFAKPMPPTEFLDLLRARSMASPDLRAVRSA